MRQKWRIRKSWKSKYVIRRWWLEKLKRRKRNGWRIEKKRWKKKGPLDRGGDRRHFSRPPGCAASLHGILRGCRISFSFFLRPMRDVTATKQIPLETKTSDRSSFTPNEPYNEEHFKGPSFGTGTFLYTTLSSLTFPFCPVILFTVQYAELRIKGPYLKIRCY